MMDNPLTEERIARMAEIIQALVQKFATEFPGLVSSSSLFLLIFIVCQVNTKTP